MSDDIDKKKINLKPFIIQTENNKVCNTCIKNDVCNIKENLEKAMNDIKNIQSRTNVFIDVAVHCKKYVRDNTYNGVR